MKITKKNILWSIVLIVVIGVILLLNSYFRTVAECNQKGREFANKILEDESVSINQGQIAYNLSYTICMREKGLIK